MFNTAVADALLWTIGVSRYSDERKELNTTQCESENIDQEGNSGGKQPSGEISESNLIEGEGSPGLIELRADCSEANESNQSMSSLSSYQGLCLNNSKKRLSWSDTLGKNLVQYDDEVSSWSLPYVVDAFTVAAVDNALHSRCRECRCAFFTSPSSVESWIITSECARFHFTATNCSTLHWLRCQS